MDQGIYEITNDGYHSSPGLSNSGISLLKECPKKYWHRYFGGGKLETDSFKLGKLEHTLLLEPDEIKNRYVFCSKEESDGRTTAHKELKEKHPYKELIKPPLKEDAYKMCESALDMVIFETAKKKLKLKDIIKMGKVEQSIYWEDRETGIMLKTRPDFIMSSRVIIDIKTARNSSMHKFKYSLRDYGYYRQAAMALDGASIVTGKKYDTFIIVAIEKNAPYCTSVFTICNRSIEKGREEYKKYAKIFKECMGSGKWPSYSTKRQEISLPEYKYE